MRPIRSKKQYASQDRWPALVVGQTEMRTSVLAAIDGFAVRRSVSDFSVCPMEDFHQKEHSEVLAKLGKVFPGVSWRLDLSKIQT
jgi:hypothetical protein